MRLGGRILSKKLFSVEGGVLNFLQALISNMKVAKIAAKFLKALDKCLNNNLFCYNFNT